MMAVNNKFLTLVNNNRTPLPQDLTVKVDRNLGNNKYLHLKCSCVTIISNHADPC